MRDPSTAVRFVGPARRRAQVGAVASATPPTRSQGTAEWRAASSQRLD